MTTDEAKAAWKSGAPVMCKGIRYDEISALIYRKERQSGKMVMTVELLDHCGHSAVVVLPNEVSEV